MLTRAQHLTAVIDAYEECFNLSAEIAIPEDQDCLIVQPSGDADEPYLKVKGGGAGAYVQVDIELFLEMTEA